MSAFTLSSNVTAGVPSTRELAVDVYRYLRDPKGPLILKLHRGGRRVVAAARAQVGYETGELSRSIYYTIDLFGPLPGLTVGSRNGVARLHHEGTKPHVIRPKNAQVLKFSSRGRVVFSREVTHPGTKANRFLTDNIYLAKI